MPASAFGGGDAADGGSDRDETACGGGGGGGGEAGGGGAGTGGGGGVKGPKRFLPFSDGLKNCMGQVGEWPGCLQAGRVGEGATTGSRADASRGRSCAQQQPVGVPELPTLSRTQIRCPKPPPPHTHNPHNPIRRLA